MKKVLLCSVVLDGEPRPVTIVFDSFEAFTEYRHRKADVLIQFTCQTVPFYYDEEAPNTDL